MPSEMPLKTIYHFTQTEVKKEKIMYIKPRESGNKK